jgi:uncharacterized protein YebE (UPF0316 family)
MVESLAGALVIFLLRVTDVSIGTVRVMYTVRGQRVTSAILGLVESGVFIFAVSSVLTAGARDPIKMVGYATGFATGTLLGVTIERWIASGHVLMRIISRERTDDIAEELREAGAGVTILTGEGRDGPVRILFVVTPRRRAKAIQTRVCNHDPKAFITLEPVTQVKGGQITSPGAFWIFKK